MSVSDRTSNAKACSSIVCICRVTVIPTKATLAPGRALFVQNWTAFRFLSNKYSFTARASTMRVFFLHWYFSIQGWSKGQNYSCATICMVHSVYDAAITCAKLSTSSTFLGWGLSARLLGERCPWITSQGTASAQQPFRLYLQKSTAGGGGGRGNIGWGL